MTAIPTEPTFWTIEPYRRVGPITLGSSRSEIETELGARSVPIDKGDALPVAAFPDLGVHAHFDDDGNCEAVELMTPAQPAINGQALLGSPFSQILGWLLERDPNLTIDATGATSQSSGIGLFAPLAAEHPDRPAEGVIVFVRDYYQT